MCKWASHYAGCLIVLAIGLSMSHPASARAYDLYRADYFKGAFCSVIGGACAADNDFDSSFFQNPASLTAKGGNWDYDYDFIKDNNTEPGTDTANVNSQVTFMLAAAYSTEKYGLGISLTRVNHRVDAHAAFYDDAAGAPIVFDTATRASNYQINAPFSYHFSRRLNLGATLNLNFFQQKTEITNSSTASYRSSSAFPVGLGFTLGAIYSLNERLNLGTWIRSPITYYYDQSIQASSSFTRFSYQEDMALNEPLVWAIGAAWTPWGNGTVFYYDLNVVGTTADGNELGYDSFATAAGSDRLVSKGRKIVIDPRIGARIVLPRYPTATLSLGAYYENSRWAGSDGFTHATGGFAYKFPNFKFLMFDGVEIMAGLDVAKNYKTFFFTYR